MEFEVLSNSLSLDVRVQAETLKRGDWRQFNKVIFYKNVGRVKGNQQDNNHFELAMNVKGQGLEEVTGTP